MTTHQYLLFCLPVPEYSSCVQVCVCEREERNNLVVIAVGMLAGREVRKLIT